MRPQLERDPLGSGKVTWCNLLVCKSRLGPAHLNVTWIHSRGPLDCLTAICRCVPVAAMGRTVGPVGFRRLCWKPTRHCCRFGTVSVLRTVTSAHGDRLRSTGDLYHIAAADWLTSVDGIRRGRNPEVNVFTGPHPSVGSLNTYMALSAIANLSVARIAKPSVRRAVWIVVSAVEVRVILHDFALGYHLNFRI